MRSLPGTCARAGGGTWTHAYLPYRETFGDWLQSRTGHFRKHLRQSDRSLQRLGELSVQRVAGADVATDGFELFLAIDGQSWKAVEGESLDRNGALRAYYGDLCRRFGASGQAEVWVPRIAGAAAAAYLCLLDGRSRYALKTSYNEAVVGSSRHSPSHILLSRIIETAWGESALGVDFLSDYSFLSSWTADPRRFGYSHFHRGPWIAARIRVRDKWDSIESQLQAVTSRINGRIVRVLRRFGLGSDHAPPGASTGASDTRDPGP